MKTSLDHLPPRKQKQLAGLVSEIRTAVDARYSTKYVVMVDELRVMAGRVKELRDRVERVCRERIEAAG
jgi:uncharacterized protein (UPF0216 family)